MHFSWNNTLFLFLLLLLWKGPTITTAFVVSGQDWPPTCLLFAKKKWSRRERRRRQQDGRPLKVRPPQQKIYGDHPVPPQSNDTKPSLATTDNHNNNNHKETSKTLTQAEQLIDVQRQSVDTLTLVKNLVDQRVASSKLVTQLLMDQNYVVIDDCFEDASILKTLAMEATALYQSDQDESVPDLAHLGCYVTNVSGGPGQYQRAPRSIETIVSLTKHLPDGFVDSLILDNANCMGRSRMFDWKAWKASNALLDASRESRVSFSTVVTDPDTDRRRLTVWLCLNDGGGGVGVEILTGEDDDDDNNYKRIPLTGNRMILFSSTGCRYRYHWEMADTSERSLLSSCLELHLIAKETSTGPKESF